MVELQIGSTIVLQTNTKGAPLTPSYAVGAPYGISLLQIYKIAKII